MLSEAGLEGIPPYGLIAELKQAEDVSVQAGADSFGDGAFCAGGTDCFAGAEHDLVVRSQRSLPERWVNRPTKTKASGQNPGTLPLDFDH